MLSVVEHVYENYVWLTRKYLHGGGVSQTGKYLAPMLGRAAGRLVY